MRTSFKHHQLRTMKSYFAINHNPDAKDLKQLAQKTGLTKRVLQVRRRARRPAPCQENPLSPLRRVIHTLSLLRHWLTLAVLLEGGPRGAVAQQRPRTLTDAAAFSLGRGGPPRWPRGPRHLHRP